MRLLLDTNICIYALKQSPPVLARMREHRPSELALSVITEAELRTGAAKSSHPTATLRRLERFLAPLQVLEFASEDAIVYAQLRAKLERAGTPIGPLDTLIAAQALSRALVLVTNDTREFSRVPRLELENWAR